MIDAWSIAIGIFMSEMLKATFIIALIVVIWAFIMAASYVQDRRHLRRQSQLKLEAAERAEAETKRRATPADFMSEHF